MMVNGPAFARLGSEWIGTEQPGVRPQVLCCSAKTTCQGARLPSYILHHLPSPAPTTEPGPGLPAGASSTCRGDRGDNCRGALSRPRRQGPESLEIWNAGARRLAHADERRFD